MLKMSEPAAAAAVAPIASVTNCLDRSLFPFNCLKLLVSPWDNL